MYFYVESVDEAYKELTARGYKFNEEPYDVPVGRLMTINDPDGNIVGLEDRSKGGLAGVAEMSRGRAGRGPGPKGPVQEIAQPLPTGVDGHDTASAAAAAAQ